MQLQSILSPERTITGVPGTSKKRVLENIAEIICKDVSYLNPEDLFSALTARERLGSTGIGEGIAIPHCRVANCTNTIGSLVRLETPVDFEAIDDKPIDILFVLLVPEEANDEHLLTLKTLAELFSQADFRESLRNAENDQALYHAAIEYQKAA